MTSEILFAVVMVMVTVMFGEAFPKGVWPLPYLGSTVYSLRTNIIVPLASNRPRATYIV